MSKEPQRTCPSCGNEFSGAMEFCPVCMLRKGLAGGVESGESTTQDTLKPTSEQPVQRYEHYVSARAPPGNVNRKKGNDATVDINDRNNGDPVFIIQVAALSWAATQVPEITVPIQSFLNAGFRSAAQVGFMSRAKLVNAQIRSLNLRSP